jgi:hypothetical protein
VVRTSDRSDGEAVGTASAVSGRRVGTPPPLRFGWNGEKGGGGSGGGPEWLGGVTPAGEQPRPRRLVGLRSRYGRFNPKRGGSVVGRESNDWPTRPTESRPARHSTCNGGERLGLASVVVPNSE